VDRLPRPGDAGPEAPGPKRRLYTDGRVREQWLIDPVDRSAVVGTASEERRLGAGDALTSPLLEG
jgi:hypothetical protein